MTTKSRNRSAIEAEFDTTGSYGPKEAVELVKQMAFAKFDESVDMAFQLGIDARQADQLVRSTVSLPHGTGKDVRVVVFAESELARAAEEAGADLVGGQELADAIRAGSQSLDFDVTIASPDMMSVVGKLGPVLGPRGLMPNPKSGTVTQDIGKTVEAFKAGRVEYRNDRYGNVHVSIGKVSFSPQQLVENLTELVAELNRARPSSAKGRFIRKVTASSTMGVGVPIDVAALDDLETD